MREGNYLQAFIFWVLLGMLPSMGYAKSLDKINTLNHLMINELSSVDSISKVKPQEGKGSKKKKEKDTKEEPEVVNVNEPRQEPGIELEPKKPNIKQVPRARPKLRPGVVDKVRIKRPPIRVKPGKVLRINL